MPTHSPPHLESHLLDNAAWASLAGPHAHLAEGGDLVRRYRPSVSPILAVKDMSDPQVWTEIEALVGPGRDVPLTSLDTQVPVGWTIGMAIEGVQLVATDALVSRPDPEALVLGQDDVDDMLALVAATQPGPFEPETYLMGTYLGIRREGTLVAMAGERMHPPGWTEISAVCTDASVRGQGLATRLVRAVAHGIRARGERPFLHAAAHNTGAIALYEHLGFELRRSSAFAVVRTPEAAV
ncbi:MAG: putative acetyltransferase [Aeromicrobium sp.]|nr:putative acetyltransferase [Aeromicrobium sp.]